MAQPQPLSGRAHYYIPPCRSFVRDLLQRSRPYSILWSPVAHFETSQPSAYFNSNKYRSAYTASVGLRRQTATPEYHTRHLTPPVRAPPISPQGITPCSPLPNPPARKTEHNSHQRGPALHCEPRRAGDNRRGISSPQSCSMVRNLLSDATPA